MRLAVARHLAIPNSLIAAHHGVLYKTIGDRTQAAFASSEDAVRAAVAAQVKDKHLLLILDNCEHLLAAVPVVGAWLTAGAGLQFLATSRAPPRLQAEHEYP